MSTPSTSEMETVERYLNSNGFTVLERSWDNSGQARLLATEHRCLVICLVNVRTSSSAGSGSSILPIAAARELRGSAWPWVAEHGRHLDLVRIDLADLVRDGNGGFAIEHNREVA